MHIIAYFKCLKYKIRIIYGRYILVMLIDKKRIEYYKKIIQVFNLLRLGIIYFRYSDLIYILSQLSCIQALFQLQQ